MGARLNVKKWMKTKGTTVHSCGVGQEATTRSKVTESILRDGGEILKSAVV